MDFAKTAHVAVPVCVCRTAELPGACERAAALADFVELRLDCLEVGEFDATVGALPSLLKNLKGGVIMTLRPSEQGGRRTLDLDERLSFWSAFYSRPQPPNVFADIELDLMPHLRERAEASAFHVDWSRIICSQHDFTGVPSALEQLYEQLAATPAGVLKIAVQARDATDCLPIFRMLERARREG
ncbi:MAG: type I 3-dehydroquinate dehydratase, partial [Acidobacteriota bacterium]|nr:type I 3-dehydroquinate dehydratase [Acidobacteriota bacterium]